MLEVINVAVRNLVSFSYFEPDIVPSADLSGKMLEGTLGHRARQGSLDESFKIEQSISSDFEYKNIILRISGRMDVFRDEYDVPEIEEIKLGNSDKLLDSPRDEHIYQLYVYGALLFNNREDLNLIKFKLAYVDVDGNVLQVFEQTKNREECLAIINALIEPFGDFTIGELRHVKSRNESLLDMDFPFEEFRKGQREFAAQVYTSIKIKKRLFACLPTGTGKSVAVLFPALKALQLGLTSRLIYLTARTAARQSPLNALRLIMDKGANIRVVTIVAKEKMCPNDLNCNPEHCSRAKGHFTRQEQAMKHIFEGGWWTEDVINDVADKFNICPFEFGLSLTVFADVSILDENYVFDPFVAIQRLNIRPQDNTLLIDEAHHLISRLRDGLSGHMDQKTLREQRKRIGDFFGKKHLLYKALTTVINKLKKIDLPEGEFTLLMDKPPEKFDLAMQNLKDCAALSFSVMKERTLPKDIYTDLADIFKAAVRFLYANDNLGDNYAVIASLEKSSKALSLYCLDPAFRIVECTQKTNGAVFFSATLSPLKSMKDMLGGDEEDAIFTLPSPFPKENLLVLRKNTNTYYNNRQSSVDEIATAICDVLAVKQGKYIAYFTSYEYMNMVKDKIIDLSPINVIVQERNMDEDAKNKFIEGFLEGKDNLLGLCVMGGSFSEGIDLPGNSLIGAFIIGVGIPVPTFKTELLKDHYEKKFGNGFAFAYQYPGMQKVLQASGRVIRSEKDRGVLMFFDKRYFTKAYESLLPTEWNWKGNDYKKHVEEFYDYEDAIDG